MMQQMEKRKRKKKANTCHMFISTIAQCSTITINIVRKLEKYIRFFKTNKLFGVATVFTALRKSV